MELVEVVVYTQDMARATAFYRDTLGLEPDFESPHWTTFRTGACTLALHLGSEAPDPTFLVEDLDAAREQPRSRGRRRDRDPRAGRGRQGVRCAGSGRESLLARVQSSTLTAISHTGNA